MQFSIKELLLWVGNAAMLLGCSPLARNFSDDPDIAQLFMLYLLFLSLSAWRFFVIRGNYSPAAELTKRVLILMLFAVGAYFFTIPFGKWGVGYSLLNVALCSAIPVASIFLLDSNRIWNTPLRFVAKIIVELTLVFPAWMFAMAIVDAYVFKMAP